MLTADQQTALLMTIADQRIQIANANGEIAMLRAMVPEPSPPEDDIPAEHGDSG